MQEMILSMVGWGRRKDNGELITGYHPRPAFKHAHRLLNTACCRGTQTTQVYKLLLESPLGLQSAESGDSLPASLGLLSSRPGKQHPADE